MPPSPGMLSDVAGPGSVVAVIGEDGRTIAVTTPALHTSLGVSASGPDAATGSAGAEHRAVPAPSSRRWPPTRRLGQRRGPGPTSSTWPACRATTASARPRSTPRRHRHRAHGQLPGRHPAVGEDAAGLPLRRHPRPGRPRRPGDLVAGRPGPAARRRHVRRGRRDHRPHHHPPGPRARDRRRDPAPGPHDERHAGPAGGGPGPPAALRVRRLARAALPRRRGPHQPRGGPGPPGGDGLAGRGVDRPGRDRAASTAWSPTSSTWPASTRTADPGRRSTSRRSCSTRPGASR